MRFPRILQDMFWLQHIISMMQLVHNQLFQNAQMRPELKLSHLIKNLYLSVYLWDFESKALTFGRSSFSAKSSFACPLIE